MCVCVCVGGLLCISYSLYYIKYLDLRFGGKSRDLKETSDMAFDNSAQLALGTRAKIQHLVEIRADVHNVGD